MSHNIIEKGSFYLIYEKDDSLIIEDRTKRGLEVKSREQDVKVGVEADMGMIYDMEGIGHRVPIRWFFPRNSYDLGAVRPHALAMEKRYTELRELTCPDD